MKKILAIILSLALALTSAVAMMVTAFADDPVEPLVVDFTDPDICAAMQLNDTGVWGPTSLATGSYDEAEDAFKIVFTEEMGAWKSLYFPISDYAQMDKEVYGLIGYYYKASGFGENGGPCGMSDGGAGFGSEKSNCNSDDYTWATWTTENFAGSQIIPSIYSAGGPVPAGAEFCLKAIVLFPDQDSFDSFDIDAYLGGGEPETSEPETSEPETSEPETSEPETSEPETSEPETSEPETSEPETSEPEANSDPIIFNYTVDDDPDTCYPDLGNFMYNWGSSVAGPSAYDADEQAWVMTSDVALGQYATAYEHIWNGSYSSVVDWNTYKYIVVVYKTAGSNETQHYTVMNDGAAGVFELPVSDDGYSKLVASTDAFHDADNEVGYQILPGICNYGAEGSEPGVSLAIKYIAFFATEEEANAYDFGIAEPETSEPETSEPETSEPETSEPETSEPETSEPETSEPETSEPETSEPETSEPETSEPETSEPETSEPETSEPEGSEESGEESGKEGADTSDVAMISGAILLCAAAATIAVVSRKRK